METKAAIFRKVHEPLTIESIDIDKPWDEVLVRTAAPASATATFTSWTVRAMALDRPIVLDTKAPASWRRWVPT